MVCYKAYMLEQIKDYLQTLKDAELRALSVASGVPYSTIIKVKYGTTKNPTYETVSSLYQWMPRKLQSKP